MAHDRQDLRILRRLMCEVRERGLLVDTSGALFKEAEAFPPLNYEKGGGSIDLAFWRAPERLFDEPDEFLTWARAALGAARRVAAKRSTPKRQAKPRRK